MFSLQNPEFMPLKARNTEKLVMTILTPLALQLTSWVTKGFSLFSFLSLFCYQ